LEIKWKAGTPKCAMIGSGGSTIGPENSGYRKRKKL